MPYVTVSDVSSNMFQKEANAKVMFLTKCLCVFVLSVHNNTCIHKSRSNASPLVNIRVREIPTVLSYTLQANFANYSG
jgi:hypothetical protein